MRCRVGSSRAAPGLAALALTLTACTPALPRFEAALAANDSATAALRQWCGARQIADPAAIRALPVPGELAPPPADAAALLKVDAPAALGYRHVRLSCGAAVLSEAHNWYVPARLTAPMNSALASTDTPFGTVAAPLHFTRERLASQRGAGAGCPAGTILTHRALLRLPDGAPLALVVECYTRTNLQRRPSA